jgi:hypothetical protein
VPVEIFEGTADTRGMLRMLRIVPLTGYLTRGILDQVDLLHMRT